MVYGRGLNMKKKFTRYPTRSIKASSSYNNMSAFAEAIADDLSEFLDGTTRIKNISDYLNSEDIDYIDKALDVLYDFAHMYSYAVE